MVAEHRFHLLLKTDGFKELEPVVLKEDLHHIRFQLERRADRGHSGEFELSGLPNGEYAVLINGRRIHKFATTEGGKHVCRYTLQDAGDNCVTIERL